jgi:hypothetical protein
MPYQTLNRADEQAAAVAECMRYERTSRRLAAKIR